MTKIRHELPGQGLREIREKLGLTLKEVEEQSRRIAEERQDFYYLISAGRLSQLENSNSLPSLYKLASLSFIYKVPLTELFRIYGVDMPAVAKDESPGKAEDPASASSS